MGTQKEITEYINKVFWVHHSDLQNLIKKDRKKQSIKNKVEDLNFQAEQEGPKDLLIRSEDKKIQQEGKLIVYLYLKILESKAKITRWCSKKFIYQMMLQEVHISSTDTSTDPDSDFEPGD